MPIFNHRPAWNEDYPIPREACTPVRTGESRGATGDLPLNWTSSAERTAEPRGCDSVDAAVAAVAQGR
jgi:hypothetical protein